MSTIPSMLSLLVNWTLSSSIYLHIGPGLLIDDTGRVNIGPEHPTDALTAIHVLAWQIMCEALGHDPAELLSLHPMSGDVDDVVFVDRRVGASGRWSIMVGGGDLAELRVLGAGDDLWSLLEEAGADMWGARQALRRWAVTEGVPGVELPGETVERTALTLEPRPAL